MPASDLVDDARVDRAREIARAVAAAGGRAVIVGGWVRDRLLVRSSKDIDLEVFGLPVERLTRLLEGFGPVNVVGEAFTVFKVADLDVSLPRRESKVARRAARRRQLVRAPAFGGA